jgi:hypothetical protein
LRTFTERMPLRAVQPPSARRAERSPTVTGYSAGRAGDHSRGDGTPTRPRNVAVAPRRTVRLRKRTARPPKRAVTASRWRRPRLRTRTRRSTRAVHVRQGSRGMTCTVTG